jgi:SAM-dependent methyltransferase
MSMTINFRYAINKTTSALEQLASTVRRLFFYCLVLFYHRSIIWSRCKICNGNTYRTHGYGRRFFHCQNCDFIYSFDYNPWVVNKGMGMEGSWSGPGGGGYREYFLAKLLKNQLGLKSFLLYGTGNTPTFEKLRQEGFDIIGCDISSDVVESKNKQFGKDIFFTPETLPKDRRYDAIIAVEVFEHFTNPNAACNQLFNLVDPNGVICGTTDFYPGGPIEDKNNPGYMSHQGHVSYWSMKSMRFVAKKYDHYAVAFEMVRPGSVLPDEKLGQLWPNKRVFFLYSDKTYNSFFDDLYNKSPILPIDKP